MTVCSSYSFPVTRGSLYNTNGHKRILWCCSQQMTRVKRFSISCHLRAKVHIKEMLLSLCDLAGGVCSETFKHSAVGSLGLILIFSLPYSPRKASNGLLSFACLSFFTKFSSCLSAFYRT